MVIDASKQRIYADWKYHAAILKYQYEVFQEVDESKLRPMIWRYSRKNNMDISTAFPGG